MIRVDGDDDDVVGDDDSWRMIEHHGGRLPLNSHPMDLIDECQRRRNFRRNSSTPSMAFFVDSADCADGHS